MEFTAFEGQNEIEFFERFTDNDTCLAYLYEQKWKHGFVCPKCGCTEEGKTSLAFHKRCKKCKHATSATANTLFHKSKMGLQKAFVMMFRMSATTKSVSAEQLAKNVGVNRKTSLAFQHKVRVAMESSKDYPMEGNVEVDEAFIGQQEEGNVGRGAVEKAQIVVAVEKNGGIGVKRVYAQVIENASTEQLKKIFDDHISPDAKVLTDKWKGYSPLAEHYNITQEKSEPDKNFLVMHRIIQQLKSWIRGIHHSVNKDFLQGYLDEFCYRINRSITKDSIFNNLVLRMIKHQPIFINQIKFGYIY